MKVQAKLKNLRVAPRKTRLVTELIKGMDAIEALNQLDSTIKGSVEPIKKLLLSAIANAENNFGLAKDNLYVLDAFVGAGPTLKRWMPKAFGRAGRIMKRTSIITIVLEERVEGKGRKSKEELEKAREERMKKKEEERKTEEQEEVVEKKEIKKEKKAEADEKIADKDKKSWKNKIFRRKSM